MHTIATTATAAAAFAPPALPPPTRIFTRVTRQRVAAPAHGWRRERPRANLASPTPDGARPDVPASPGSSLASLHELTERIAHLLHVGSLQKNPLHCPKDAPLGYLSATTHVAVVFGKHLIRDQITVEYAKRVVTLVKQIASGALDPDVICFTGGRGLDDTAAMSEAVAGYAFFRSVCEEAAVNVDRFTYILEEKSHNTQENLRNVIEELRRRSGSQAVSGCHFTLVSSDYHLIRIQEVHRLSPRQSVLFPLEVSAATWNCIFAAYPFCVSRDPATAFLGRAVVLANDLAIVLVNLNGAIDDRQFLARENLHRLQETFAKMRDMYRLIDLRTASSGGPSGGFRTDMRTHAETLELAIHDVREVQTLLAPLNETGASVPHAHLELARELLTGTISKMRRLMDPDRVLRVHDRMAIIDDMVSYVDEQKARLSQPPSAATNPAAPPPALPAGLEDPADHEQLVSDRSDPADFEPLADGRPPRRRPSGRKRITMSSEVTWRGGAIFKGNGKKITRDGPNLVIADSSCAPSFATPQPPKRTRARSTAAATTAQADADALSGSRLEQPPAVKPRPRASQTRQPATRTSTRASTRAPSATRKRKEGATAPTKKRKPTSRKLARPAAGDAA